MFWNFTYKAGRVLSPILIHYLAANVIMMIWVSLRLQTDAAFLTSITAAVLLPLFYIWYQKDRQRENAKKKQLCLWECAGIAVFGIFCNFLIGTLAGAVSEALQLNNAAQEMLYESPLLVQLIGIGIIVPFMEEVLFRGLVYKRLKEYTGNDWTAILAAAALFAVYHGNLTQMLFAFPMAFILIFIYRKWDTLWAPVIFHAAVNISSILLTVWTQGVSL